MFTDELYDANEVIIYGYTELGKKIMNKLTDKNIPVVFLDREKESEKDTIIRPERFDWNNMKTNRKYVIASTRYSFEMREFLLSNGINENEIYMPQDVLYKGFCRVSDMLKKRMPRKKISLIFCITEHCNLNCAMCDHFSPLSDKWFMNLDNFKNDLCRMKEICGDNSDKIEMIKIEGGEPLLHSRIIDFLEEARRIFHNIDIYLLTNGILLNEMPDSFWETCKKNEIIIKVTRYPIGMDYKHMQYMVEKKGINFEFSNDSDLDKSMIKETIDIEGNQDKYVSFNNCAVSNGLCMSIKNGKLFQCTTAQSLPILGDFFGRKIEVLKKDYLDIYSDISFGDIQDYLCNPISLCRYCNTQAWVGGNEWHVSQRKINEWV